MSKPTPNRSLGRRRTARKAEAVSLGDAISEWLRLSGHGARLQDARTEAAWREVMGEAVSRKTRFIRVRDGVLTVELDSGPMKEEFLMARTRIQNMINEHLGRETIRQVVIR